MKQTLIIPGRLPGCNEYTEACRTNPRVGSRMKRKAQNTIGWAIKQGKIKPTLKQVDIHVTWIEPNMRRDKDNIRFAMKFILDSLVEMGILPNDGWKYVGNLSDSYLVNKSDPRVIVEIMEVDNG